jgi:hypothetical protein
LQGAYHDVDIVAALMGPPGSERLGWSAKWYCKVCWCDSKPSESTH